MEGFPFVHRETVRFSDLDGMGHVNNAVYLNWAEEIAGLHAEAAGYGRAWAVARGGTWVVHHADITWRRPALEGDEVEVEVRVESIRSARGIRRTLDSARGGRRAAGRAPGRVGLGADLRRSAGPGAEGAG